MLKWEELVYNLRELSKLPNGSGSEIEFEYKGNDYVIVHYKNWCSLCLCTINADGKYEFKEREYSTLEELGNANDFGFCLAKEWDNIENLLCKPDFETDSLNVVLDAYNDA